MPSVLDEVAAIAQVKRGRLFIVDRAAFDQRVARLDERWTLEITVKRLKATRSLSQNNFYWGVIVQLISEHTGYTPDELHDVLKMKFIPKQLAISDGNGEVKGDFVLGGSTRNMSTIEFGEYCESIRRWAAEALDIDIPDPDPDATTASSQRAHGWGV